MLRYEVADPCGDPIVEQPNVVFAGDQDAAVGVDLRGHARLASLAGGEILLVNAVEEFHR
ncbi:hypothetical protein GCM10025778_30640 [Paeniglutamicibacter antarcticus]|uniref:Uncharacterized protein n=1 Tax=Paeniglutamicibacter antarcticus TaxID=494023 RepID=A0ABP9TQV2_9MICC